ncbi:MAG: translation initiation factor IF-2 N-terminal domain-containing protein, partial [Thermoanaerobaculia bacterium]
MAAAKLRVSDLAKKMNVSDKDLIFKLQSLGAEITDSNQVLEPEVIQAILTGKKLATRTRTVILREDKPLPQKKKEAVRPPRPIIQPPVRARREAPKEETPVAPAAPPMIIPEFVEAVEAEERAAKEAPAAKPARASKRAHVEAPAEPVAETPMAAA